jgi:hypothetical protein
VKRAESGQAGHFFLRSDQDEDLVSLSLPARRAFFWNSFKARTFLLWMGIGIGEGGEWGGGGALSISRRRELEGGKLCSIKGGRRYAIDMGTQHKAHSESSEEAAAPPPPPPRRMNAMTGKAAHETIQIAMKGHRHSPVGKCCCNPKKNASA